MVGDYEHAKRHIDPTSPTGLFPLLERPMAVIVAELEEWEEKHGRTRGFLARQVPLDAVIAHALVSGSVYWADLALKWVDTIAARSSAVTDAPLTV